MTGMLASVATLKEAKIVLDQKVDIIDLKNPRLGALGALDQKVISSVVELVNNSIPTSATIGDINPDDTRLSELILDTAKTGVNFVKVGLFDKNIPDYFVKIINQCGKKNINIIIVFFAEDITNINLLDSLMESNIKGVMIDTKNKSSMNLCSLIKYETLNQFIKLAKSYNLLTGLAGSLKYEDIEGLISLRPDYLGFRGALCSKRNRIKSIDEVAVKKIRDVILQKKNIYYKDIFHKEVLINDSVA